MSKPALTLISTPYREGGHSVSKPSQFIPIIKNLHCLHELGYVHGDIRAFNTVIGNESSYLIDFDFAGKAGFVKYPPGYNFSLEDGSRIGRPNQKIEKCNDWFDLGSLIFEKYNFEGPENMQLDYMKMRKIWTIIERLKNVEDYGAFVEGLVSFLRDAEDKGCMMEPGTILKIALKGREESAATLYGATGSPPPKGTK
jgi:serine/threonine protein kinase